MISVYWHPGCSSCLRTKEFLTRHGVSFRSCNVLEDDAALDELNRFGLRQVPIVVRGDKWVNGQILRDVAKLCGIALESGTMLPPQELRLRATAIIGATLANLQNLPDAILDAQLPNRPRSLRELVYHTFNIIDAFLEHEDGIALLYEAYCRQPPDDMRTSVALAAYGRDVSERFEAWFSGRGERVNWNATANVYYGEQTLHEFLERTTWHAAQHARQFIWALEQRGVEPSRPLDADTLRGLPVPESVWDGEPPSN